MTKCNYCDKEHKNNNTGCDNSGNCNSGDWNSGDWNSGNWNSGNRNSGYSNSGNWNSGDRNSGIFNTNEPKMRSFNRECEYTYTEFREKWGYQDIDIPICVWVDKEDMTAEEKTTIKGWDEMGGYLKTLDYKEAWKVAWEKASQEQKDWYKSLPNFDTSIFKEITGIDIEESLIGQTATVEIGGKKYKAKITSEE